MRFAVNSFCPSVLSLSDLKLPVSEGSESQLRKAEKAVPVVDKNSLLVGQSKIAEGHFQRMDYSNAQI